MLRLWSSAARLLREGSQIKDDLTLEVVLKEHELNLTSYQVIADNQQEVREQLTELCDAGTACRWCSPLGGRE